ncbi:MAG TPA: urease accessory protein UreD [Casimicrobiaceae bacterium]|nr:urease accessory protein UreD [Casimicrobiaceae bacterium]
MRDASPREAPAATHAGWEARLELAYRRDGPRTVLDRRHSGPLLVQKPLYPEGGAVCQSIVVHPPGGIAGGDRLMLEARVGPQARAQLTTPAASKWYRTTGAPAQQTLRLSAEDGAILEWLPQEGIVFAGAIADLATDISLADDAVFLGWDIVCLGRRLAGERWTQGRLRHDFALRRGGRRQWVERTALSGGSELLAARVGLGARTVFGTFLASAASVPDDLVSSCRAVDCDDGDAAVTRLPGVLLARYRGDSAEAARDYFAALWARARPALAGMSAVAPRIWNT